MSQQLIAVVNRSVCHSCDVSGLFLTWHPPAARRFRLDSVSTQTVSQEWITLVTPLCVEFITINGVYSFIANFLSVRMNRIRNRLISWTVIFELSVCT